MFFLILRISGPLGLYLVEKIHNTHTLIFPRFLPSH